MKKGIVFALVLVVSLVAMMGNAAAFHGIAGTVYNATDGTPANGHTAIVYYPGDEAHNVSDIIGPAGDAHTDNMYLCDAELIPGHVWQVGDEINVKVIDTGDGYTAGPVSVVTTGAGYDVAPNMSLLLPLPPIVSDPQAIPSEIVVNSEFTELQVKVTRTYFDIDTVMINLTPIGGTWVPMNGSTYRWLMMYAIANVSNTTTFNCTTNASVVGSFSLTVNATDIKGSSNISVSIPLVVTAPKPDLIVTNITLSAGALFSGKSNEICATVKNNNTGNAGPFNVSFAVDGFSAEVPVGGLTAGAETTVCVTDPTARAAGASVTINVTADSKLEVDEINETNNARSMATVVQESAVMVNYILIKKAGSTGKNWISIPLTTEITNASSLMAAIGGTCDAVSRWNAEQQKSEPWISFMGGVGTNFNIVANEGYEVSVTANTSWTPT
jgi:hypothetical protein